MTDLLFLTQRIPYPPDKGDKIRSWHFLRHLASRHRVHLGCFYDDPFDERYIPHLTEICASVKCLRLNRIHARLRSLAGLLTSASLSETYFHDPRLAQWVEETMTRHNPEIVFVFCSAMAPYLASHRGARSVLDMVDIDSEKWRAYSVTRPWPLSALYRREQRTVLRLERQAAAVFDCTILVSLAEADMFRRLAPESAGTIHCLGNGVDLEYFHPQHPHLSPFQGAGPFIVFTGAMDYWPNIEAVEWFSAKVMPLLRDRHAMAEFWIVGANPTAAVQRLGRLPGVKVTGRVPDIRPYLAHASAVVAPLHVARGIQNKVLEAMAMARPVIATPQACEGLEDAAADEVLRASSPADFVAAIDRTLTPEGTVIGRRARVRAEAGFSWARSLGGLDLLLAGGTAPQMNLSAGPVISESALSSAVLGAGR